MTADEFRFGIIHRAGCNGEQLARAMPFRTMAGQGPIVEEANGNGGERFRCLVCGAVEGGTAPLVDAPPDRGIALEEIVARCVVAFEDDRRPRMADVATELGTSVSTIKRVLAGPPPVSWNGVLRLARARLS